MAELKAERSANCQLSGRHVMSAVAEVGKLQRGGTAGGAGDQVSEWGISR